MIRKVEHKDIENIYKLASILDIDFQKKNDLELVLNNPIYTIYVNESDDIINGFIEVCELYESIEILYIVVNSKFYHQGIGNSLLNHAINCRKEAKFALLEVRSNNTPAINLYLKNGFRIINKRAHYYDNNEDALIFQKEL